MRQRQQSTEDVLCNRYSSDAAYGGDTYACGDAVLQELLAQNMEFAAGMAISEKPLNERDIERLRSLGYIR